jgi:CHAT domain-containing protein
MARINKIPAAFCQSATGRHSVVASLWNVEDSSTAQLMASFYKNLKTMTNVAALRQAQLNLIRGNINSDLLTRSSGRRLFWWGKGNERHHDRHRA